VGTPAPGLAGVTPAGDHLRIETGPGTRLVAAFLTSTCTTCGTFWTALAAEPNGDAADADAPRPALVVVTPDPTTENRRAVARLAPAVAPVVMSTDGWLSWGVPGSPFFVVVADGVIVAEGVASDWDEMLALIPAG
jgi:hypothetical protein